MHPLKIRVEKNDEIRALFIAADGYPMPGETFTYDARTYTVHTVAHAWHTRGRAIICHARKVTP